MALRCLLVSLVASLGFELPSGQDVTSWTRLGREWSSARTITLADLQADATRDFVPTVPTAAPPVTSALAVASSPAASELSGADDRAFSALGEAMAAAFAADFEADHDRIIAEDSAPAPAAEAVVTTEPACQPEQNSMALVHPQAVAVEPIESARVHEPTAATRLDSAVRATRQAVDAWALLVQAMGREVVVR